MPRLEPRLTIARTTFKSRFDAGAYRVEGTVASAGLVGERRRAPERLQGSAAVLALLGDGSEL